LRQATLTAVQKPADDADHRATELCGHKSKEPLNWNAAKRVRNVLGQPEVLATGIAVAHRPGERLPRIPLLTEAEAAIVEAMLEPRS
jgi:hypothetical protein